MWLRHHDSTVEQRSADRFTVAMRVLSRRSPRDEETGADMDAPDSRGAGGRSGAAGSASPAGSTGSGRGPAVDPARRALMRIRRQRLYVLIGALPVTIMVAVLLGGTWYIVQAIEDVGLFVYLAHLRSVARVERARRTEGERTERAGRGPAAGRPNATRPAARADLSGSGSGRPSASVGRRARRDSSSAAPVRLTKGSAGNLDADIDDPDVDDPDVDDPDVDDVDIDARVDAEVDLALAEAETVDLRDIAAAAADRIAAEAAGDGAGLDGRPLALPPGHGARPGDGHRNPADESYAGDGYDGAPAAGSEDYEGARYAQSGDYAGGGYGYESPDYDGYAADGYDAYAAYAEEGVDAAAEDPLDERAAEPEEPSRRGSGRPTARPPGGRPTTSRPGRVQVSPPGTHGGLTAGPRVSAPSASGPPAAGPAPAAPNGPAPAVDDGDDSDGLVQRRAVGS
jgi:hypothetical protein